jgi:uncharacterized protein YcbX
MPESSHPVLDRITLHPFKSLDGMEVEEATISPGGCLLHDREFALRDRDGQMVIGKTNALVHTLRTEFDLVARTISVRREGESDWRRFDWLREQEQLEAYFSDHFGTPIELVRDTTGRLLDIPDQSGATVVSTASLQAVGGWFPRLDFPQVRRRFRTSLELSGVPAFWEDRLFGDRDHVVEFTVGEVTFFGISPRARCVVPTRDPMNGEPTSLFPRTFAKGRAASLPGWSTLREHPHAYYLAVDCLIPPSEVGKVLRVGDPVVIVGPRER